MNRGFTLVEIMVATVILAIGIGAALSVQWNALAGYSQARDISQATQLGQRIIDIMRIESQQWNSGTDISSIKAAYQNPGSTNIWKSPPTLNRIRGSDWTTIIDKPVDVRFADTGNTRFCAYGRAKESDEGDMAKVQIVVIFPKPGTSWGDSCSLSDNSFEDEDIIASDPTELEYKGYSAVHTASIIRRRAHL